MRDEDDITRMKTRELGRGSISVNPGEAYPRPGDSGIRMAETYPSSEALPSEAVPESPNPVDLDGRPVADASLFAGGIPQDPFSGDPFVGQMVGNCRILEKINEGGSSWIYRARNLTFNLDRVVKILKPTLADDEENFDRFKQEAQLTARLDHPNILRVFDTGVIGSQFYIEMEFVEGQSLRAFMASHYRVRELDMLGIASQIVNALEYAHSAQIHSADGPMIHGILHRDIKPENIMVTSSRTIKLMDFGAAKPMTTNSRTMQGTVVGTPHYMSPEQINGEPLDARSDYFSLGVVMYELAAGRRPFEADNLATLLWTIDECKVQRLRKVRSAITPMTEELVERLLAKNPDHRPRGAREIQEALQTSIQALRAWGSGQPAKIPYTFRRALPILAFTFSVVALVLSGYNLWRGYLLVHGFAANPQLRSYFSSLLDKGIQAEQAKDYSAALATYDLIPSPAEGGDRAAYLEGRIRSAAIYFKHRDQLTKARSVLEQLRKDFDDPAIDAYLGQLCFKQALYLEAKERLESFFNSTKTTVLRNSNYFNPNELQRDALYAYANAIDGQFIFIEQKPETLDEAILAWDRFLRFSDCASDPEDKRCRFAEKRTGELTALRKKG